MSHFLNPQIERRLEGIHQVLMGAFHAGGSMSSASKGSEREVFVNNFLAQMLTPQFRIGTGDITDQADNKSGQIDLVVENAFVPSLPVWHGSPRLYLAEGVAAVVEVKSDLTKQWSEVKDTASKLAVLRRNWGSGMALGRKPPERIPVFAVGFEGWKKVETVWEHIKEGVVDGILVVASGQFGCEMPGYRAVTNLPNENTKALALWQFLTGLHHTTSLVTTMAKNAPGNYVKNRTR